MRPTLSTILSLILLSAADGEVHAKNRPANPDPPVRSAETSPVGELARRLPVDPLFVSAMVLDDPAAAVAGLLDTLERFGGGELDRATLEQQLAEFNRAVGCSIVDDLFARLGPALALVIDLPPIDSIAGVMVDPQTGIPRFLSGVGMLAQVRDAGAVDGCLRKLLTKAGAEVDPGAGKDGLVRFRFPLGEAPPDGAAPGIELVYGMRNGMLALGAAPELVQGSLGGRTEGTRLIDGADYAGLFRHLDPEPSGLTYVNLPKLATLLRESAMFQGLLDGQAEARPIAELFLGSEMSAAGLGSTSVEIDGRTRSTTIGPPGFSGGMASSGIIAAIAIPNLLNAIDRGKQKRTMADLRSVGTSIEAYRIDHEAYPTIGEGWQPAQGLLELVAPMYIRRLPVTDGWEQSMLYWSDGKRYRIVSAGKGGEIDGDWSGPIEPSTTSAFPADIVFADGSFVVLPEGQQD